MLLITDKLGLVKQTSTFLSFVTNTANKNQKGQVRAKADELEKIYVKKTARNIKGQELKNVRVGLRNRED